MKAALPHRSYLLIPPAVVAWIVAMIVPRGSAGVVVGLIVVGLLTFAVAAWAWLAQPTAAAVGSAVVAAASVLVAMSSMLHIVVRDAEPWPELIEQRTLISADLEVVTPARQVTGGPVWQAQRNEQRFSAKVLNMASAERAWQVGSRVAAVATLPNESALLRPGDRLRGDFRVTAAFQPHLGHSASLRSAGSVAEPKRNDAWTAAVTTRLREALPVRAPEQASLVLGMVFGEDSGLSEANQQAMLTSGLSHLTAVSGANIAIVTGAVLLVGKFAGLSMRLALAPALGVLAAYVAVVGPEPSVIRATAMALIGIAGIALGGGSGVAALALAVTGLLILDPWLAYSRGFALSAAATAGLIAMAVPGRVLILEASQRVPSWLQVPVTAVLAAALTALAAGIATTPLIASYGQGISVISVVANVAAAPMVPFVTVAGLVVTLLAWVLPPLAELGAVLPVAGAGWILQVAGWAAAVPGGRIPWPEGVWPALLLTSLLVGLLVLGIRWRWVPILASVTLAVGSVVAAVVPGSLGGPTKGWLVVVCDVGQGDATLLRTGETSAVLVDAGPEPTSAADCLRRHGINQVPAVILSHFHADHVTGAATVVEAFDPSDMLVSALPEPADTYRATLAAIASVGQPERVVPRQGQQFTAGWVSLTVLGPSRVIREGSAPNNASLVLSATVTSPHGRVSVLLTGDIEPEAQRSLLTSIPPIDVDVAKIPHHGSANQHPAFPSWAGAEFAVVSSGADNDYGHPSEETVQTWQAAGATVLRTDLGGDVIAVARPEGPPAMVTRTVSRFR